MLHGNLSPGVPLRTVICDFAAAGAGPMTRGGAKLGWNLVEGGPCMSGKTDDDEWQGPVLEIERFCIGD